MSTQYSMFLFCTNSKANINCLDLSLSMEKLNTKWKKLLDTEGMANVANTQSDGWGMMRVKIVG